jgi:cell division protein FtsI (penicillin-binding protein 3)
MAAAQMRKMMEGVVLYGTGKPAQLNGYSSGGKTGTAQKIDPNTHTYSKTMHIGSFAGIAPINNPVIAIAVVMDNAKGAGNAYYGGPAAAPVFTQVAQETLEYLGVPHDIEVHAPRPAANQPAKEVEPEQERTSDVNAIVAAVNDLPTDDPLREAVAQAREAAKTPPVVHINVAGKSDNHDTTSKDTKKHPSEDKPVLATAEAQSKPSEPAPEGLMSAKPAAKSGGNTIKVPSLIGLPVRQVVEQAAIAGLNLSVEGRGLVRSQQPAAGSQVHPGTPILVHCAR